MLLCLVVGQKKRKKKNAKQTSKKIAHTKHLRNTPTHAIWHIIWHGDAGRDRETHTWFERRMLDADKVQRCLCKRKRMSILHINTVVPLVPVAEHKEEESG